ncbi:Estradiol 17-beta-dehydrogenase 11 [Charadrius vociferus]|uniref:Estradiol 17-beta-dehydrogenase 11 n=1 Tax=Charadrius vociferus TaxID=50402 RepID=A0A0A0ALL1_CHAVO|nr:Estradiol 17-beta-dehydrogenase 11 [Charadrius vociferus]
MNPFLDLLLFLATLIYSYLEAFVKLFVPVKRKSVSGELVLITGAGHGVGRATAFEFAKRQSRLVLWDINKREHGGLQAAVGTEDVGVWVPQLLGANQRGSMHSLSKSTCKREHGGLQAAVGTTAEAGRKRHTQPEAYFCRGAGLPSARSLSSPRAFLPAMMNNNHGHIVTVASAAGHFVTSFMVAYCSSKFAAVGFHKALTEELSTLGKDGIKTTCLCPVFINTGFVKNPSTRLGKILEIEEVVEALMEGILTNQKMIFVPSHLTIALLSEMLFPERALNFLKKLTNAKFDAVIGQRSTQ